MFSVHQQTIRLYEKQGLITPKRSDGGTRLFSEEDIDKLEEVIRLTHELGINLAGVEMVLKLQRQIKKMQADMNKLFDHTQQELDQEAAISKRAIVNSTDKLLEIKRKHAPLTEIKNSLDAEMSPDMYTSTDSSPVDVHKWEIEYDE